MMTTTLVQHTTPTHALKASVKSLLNPRIWGYLLLPALLTFLFFIILLLSSSWWLYDLINDALLSISFINNIHLWLTNHHIWGLDVWITPLLTIGSILIISNLLSMMLMGVFFDTAMINYIQQRYYPSIEKRSEFTWKNELSYNLKFFFILIPCAFLSIFFWFIPPLAIAWVFAYNGFIQSKLLSYSSLVEFSGKTEMQAIRTEHKRSLFWIGALAGGISLIPLLGFFASGFAILWFTHFCLKTLAIRRSGIHSITH